MEEHHAEHHKKERAEKETIKEIIKDKDNIKRHGQEHKEHVTEHHGHEASESAESAEKTGRHSEVKEEIDKKHDLKQKPLFSKPLWGLLAVAVILLLFNQYQLITISKMIDESLGLGSAAGGKGGKGISDLNLNELKSTGHTLAAVFPVEDISTADDAMAILFPTGTPEYGGELGVSFDDPVGSLETLSRMYRGLKAEVEQNNPAGFQRFMNLALKPVGISCEFCCGVGAVGIDSKGNSACGCQHNPALLSIALYLSAYTDYTDGEILREVMRWKTLFFPKNMIELGMSVAGGDTSALNNLPGMVGGC